MKLDEHRRTLKFIKTDENWWKPTVPKIDENWRARKVWNLMNTADPKIDETCWGIKLMKTAGPEKYETWGKPPDPNIDEKIRKLMKIAGA